MPGFKVSWSYNMKFSKTNAKYEHYLTERKFRRFANIIHRSSRGLGSIINSTRSKLLRRQFECEDSEPRRNLLSDTDLQAQILSIERKLGLEADYKIIDNIETETLQEAGKWFVYLLFCPPIEEMEKASNQTEASIQPFTPKQIIKILSRMVHAKGDVLPFKKQFTNILEKIRARWNTNHLMPVIMGTTLRIYRSQYR